MYIVITVLVLGLVVWLGVSQDLKARKHKKWILDQTEKMRQENEKLRNKLYELKEREDERLQLELEKELKRKART